MPGRFSLTVVVLIAAGVWAAALILHGGRLDASFFSPASTVVSALVILFLVFDRWLWSLRGVNKIWHRPDLRGTWKGEIKSQYPDATEPIEAYLSIHETFSIIVVRLFTAESHSKTQLAAIQTDEDHADSVLGVYRNEPDLALREKSPIHDGTFALRFEDSFRLRGKYWTDRGTRGEMTFHRISERQSTDYHTARQRS